jgi:hypothetical protein
MVAERTPADIKPFVENPLMHSTIMGTVVGRKFQWKGGWKPLSLRICVLIYLPIAKVIAVVLLLEFRRTRASEPFHPL